MVFWQPRASSRLNAEDGRQMIENVSGFVSQLSVWDVQAQSTAPSDSKSTPITAIGWNAVDESKSTQEHRLCNPVPDSFAA